MILQRLEHQFFIDYLFLFLEINEIPICPMLCNPNNIPANFPKVV